MPELLTSGNFARQSIGMRYDLKQMPNFGEVARLAAFHARPTDWDLVALEVINEYKAWKIRLRLVESRDEERSEALADERYGS